MARVCYAVLVTAAGVLFGPPAFAAIVSGTYSGVLSAVDNPSADLPSFVAPGAPITLGISFDPANFTLTTPPCTTNVVPGQTAGCAARWAGTGLGALTVTVDFGADCDEAPGVQPCTPNAESLSRIWVGDDFADGGSAADRLLFVVFERDARWLLQLVGSPTTFSGTNLPTSLTGLSFGLFEFCGDPNLGGAFLNCPATDTMTDESGKPVTFAVERIVGVPVPEPDTLALFGTGLLATVAARRRR